MSSIINEIIHKLDEVFGPSVVSIEYSEADDIGSIFIPKERVIEISKIKQLDDFLFLDLLAQDDYGNTIITFSYNLVKMTGGRNETD